MRQQVKVIKKDERKEKPLRQVLLDEKRNLSRRLKEINRKLREA